jgi:hypothetical protein
LAETLGRLRLAQGEYDDAQQKPRHDGAGSRLDHLKPVNALFMYDGLKGPL